MNPKIEIEKVLNKVLDKYQFDSVFLVEHSSDLSNGDYVSNSAFIFGKKLNKNPKELAEEIAGEIRKENLKEIEKIEVAGAGFINFFLSKDLLARVAESVISLGKEYGRGEIFNGIKTMVEYTDPNPFKEFHIGHLMPNVIGESLANLYEWSGGDVKRVCYQGDIGLHVACAVWGMIKLSDETPKEDASLKTKVEFLGKAYVKGSKANKEYEASKIEIREINKKIFEKSDENINTLYETGKKWSLDYFETIYTRLGTKFDFYFFESLAFHRGLSLVRQNIPEVFEESEGAIVFKGEKYGLHTRVFINKDGLPTYEAKELGLFETKYEMFPYDLSIVVTGNEIQEYFKVLIKAFSFIRSDLSEKTVHVPHGMLRLPTGKMSSRTGDIVTADSLISDVKDGIRSKMKNDSMSSEEKEKIVEIIAIGAIKFSILRQAIGKDIIFDFEKSLSFEGDSGPYLQYTTVRAKAVVAKAKKAKKEFNRELVIKEVSNLESLISRFPEIVKRSGEEKSPHYLITYLIELASSFNTYYAQTKIIDDSPESEYRLALTEAIAITIENGLSILGIRVPERM